MVYKISTKIKCDVRDCKNDAVYGFDVKGRGGRCCLCADCLAAVASEARAHFVPKSPLNAIKKRMEQESAYEG